MSVSGQQHQPASVGGGGGVPIPFCSTVASEVAAARFRGAGDGPLAPDSSIASRDRSRSSRGAQPVSGPRGGSGRTWAYMVPDLGIGVGGPPQAAKAGRPGGRVEREAGGRTWCPHLHAVGFILK